MEVKDFERFLELKEWYKEHYMDIERDDVLCDEYYKLQHEFEDFVFENQTNKEQIICKLKDALATWKYSFRFGDKGYDALNEIKAVREILSLLDTYDWKLHYSQYTVSSITEPEKEFEQIAVWEQNSDGQIRNYKTWNVVETHNAKMDAFNKELEKHSDIIAKKLNSI